MASNRTVFNQETFQNLQFIKAFGILDRVTEKFRQIQNETVDIALKQNKFQQRMTIITSLVGQVVGYACHGFAAFRLWQGQISYGTMTMFVSMASSLRSSFRGILNLMPMLIRTGISVERIMEITNLPRDSMEDKEEAEEIKMKAKEQGVPLQNITFSSDGMGSWSTYDEAGNLLRIGYSAVDTVYQEIKRLVQEYKMPLEAFSAFYAMLLHR